MELYAHFSERVRRLDLPRSSVRLYTPEPEFSAGMAGEFGFVALTNASVVDHETPRESLISEIARQVACDIVVHGYGDVEIYRRIGGVESRSPGPE